MQTLHTALGLPPKTFWSLCTFVWHVSTPKKHLLSSESLKMLLFFSSVKYFLLYKWSSFVVEHAVFPWEFYNSFLAFGGIPVVPFLEGKGPFYHGSSQEEKDNFLSPQPSGVSALQGLSAGWLSFWVQRWLMALLRHGVKGRLGVSLGLRACCWLVGFLFIFSLKEGDGVGRRITQ